MATGRGWAHPVAFLREREPASADGPRQKTRTSRRLRVLLAVGGGALVLLVLAVLLGLPGGDPFGDDGEPLVPAEYIYLDNHRVDAYLGQLDNGSADEERRSATLSRRAEAKAHGGQVLEVGGSLQEDQFVERVVTRTAADRVFELRKRLRDDYGRRALDLASPGDRDELAKLRAGAFVELENARLQVPTYALPLPKLAYARRAYAPEQAPVKRLALTNLLARHADAVNRYLRGLGSDPRIPAVVRTAAPPATQLPGAAEKFTIFVPLRYSKLSDAPGLMAGRVTIFGKVISRVDVLKRSAERGGGRFSYFDVETELTFGRALRRAPRGVRDALEITRPMDTIRQTALAPAPGLVVVPLAVFY